MSMIEIVVAMFLIAIIALSLLPVFASTMHLSQKNIEVGRASQVVNAQLALAGQQASLTATCAAVASLAISAFTAVPGTQNSDLVYERDVAACPSVYPSTVKVTVVVSTASGHALLAQASTLVAVTSAS